MALRYSVAIRNARLDVVESTIGASAQLVILTGSEPASCAAAETGTRLAVMTLPADWAAAASAGTKALLGTWQDASADATGTAAYFRIYDSAGTTCGVQGTVTASGGGGQLQLASTAITSGQPVQITSFTLTAGNP